MGAVLRHMVVAGLCLGGAGAAIVPGHAAEKTSVLDKTFMGHPIESHPGRYVVTKDVNVRKAPKTRSKKIDVLSRGERLYASGRAKADKEWLAVLKGGEPLGFVFGDMLMPLIDGALKKILRGTAKSGDGGSCEYAIRFDGKSPVADDLFEVADYTVQLKCSGDEKALTLTTPLFLTEAPYRMGGRPEYQVTLDLVEIAKNEDEVMSTTSIYDADKEIVRFEAISFSKFKGKVDLASLPATDVEAVLHGAVRIAVGAWNEKVWKALAKEAP